MKKLEVVFSCELEDNIKILENEKSPIQRFLSLIFDIRNKMQYTENDVLTFFISQIDPSMIGRNPLFDSSKIDAFILKNSSEQRAFEFFDDNFFSQNEQEEEIDDLGREIFGEEQSTPYLSKYHFEKVGLNLYIGKNFPKEKRENIDLFFIVYEDDINELLYNFDKKNQTIFVINPNTNSKVFYFEQKIYQLGCPKKQSEYGILKLTFQNKKLIRQSYETVSLNTRDSDRSYILHNY